MANLGSTNTPVEGSEYQLPAGAKLDEDSGDLVIRDSNGTIVFRRNESAGEWQFESTDITGVSSLTVNGTTTTGALNAGGIDINNTFSSVQNDAELSNALSNANDGDIILLLDGKYFDNYTIDETITFYGSPAGGGAGSSLEGNWTLNTGGVTFNNIEAPKSFSLNVNSDFCHIHGSNISGDAVITVSGSFFIYTGNLRGEITFDSGTNGGIVDGCSGTFVSDNGSNTVGDIA